MPTELVDPSEPDLSSWPPVIRADKGKNRAELRRDFPLKSYKLGAKDLEAEHDDPGHRDENPDAKVERQRIKRQTAQNWGEKSIKQYADVLVDARKRGYIADSWFADKLSSSAKELRKRD